MTMKPIHTATINGQLVRFFKTPINDGKPDFPWNSTDDLMKSCGLPSEMIEYFMRGSKDDHGDVYRTIATPDGLVTIAPHCVGQGFTQAMVDVGRAPESFVPQYTIACFMASKCSPEMSMEGVMAAFHRHSDGVTTKKGA